MKHIIGFILMEMSSVTGNNPIPQPQPAAQARDLPAQPVHARRMMGLELSTDPASVEVATEQLTVVATARSKLSTDPVSVEAATGRLLNGPIGLFARRFSLKVAAPTDAGSVESDQFHLSSLGLAFQS